MATLRQFLQSLYFKIGTIVILVELIILLLVGNVYITLFSNQIDLRSQERASLPGDLVRKSILRLVTIGDSRAMRQLVGEDLLSTMLVDDNLVVAYSFVSSYSKKPISDVPELDATWFNFDQAQETFQQIREDNNVYLVKVTPIDNPVTGSLEYYLYVKLSTNEAEAEKRRILELFALGSAGTIVATSLIIFVLFYTTILRRLSATLRVVQAVENGDLTVRLTHIGSRDEIGILQTGVNAMIVQLEGLVGSLEEKVRERTRQLEQARQQAEEASNAKSVFLSNMSHELRTPLNMVIGYTSSMLHMPQMYQNQPLPEVFRSDVQLIQDNGQYLLGLINDILDLSKIEAGKFNLQFSAVDIPLMLNGVIATSTGLLKDKAVQIRPDFSLDLPRIWADPMRVRQILLNLMSNAIKFTETGTVILAAHEHNGRVQFSITDTGIGMSESAMRVIFDRFEQVRQKDAIQGTGLGLDISQRLAHLHGTEITVKSAVGQGSTFSFSLALATPEQIAATGDKPALVKESTVTLFDDTAWDSASDHTILLIEDDADTRTMIHRMLEAEGYIVLAASDGAQGLDLATGVLPEMIIMDLLLKDMSGWDVITQLKADAATKETPIIIFSNAPDMQRAQELGVLKCLQKASDPSILLTHVKQFFASDPKEKVV